MKSPILNILFIAVFTAAPHAATFNSDGSRADVQAKINLASDGDTVTIPAGTFAWSSPVTISGKGISLVGAGSGTVQGASTTSLAIGTGTKAFTVNPQSLVSTPWSAGQSVVAHYKVDPSKFMSGTVTSYSGGVLTIDVTSTNSTGTFDRWYFETPATTIVQHNAGTDALLQVTEDTTSTITLTAVQFEKGTGTGFCLLVNASVGGRPVLLHDTRFSKSQVSIRWQSNSGVIWNTYFDTQDGWRIEFNNQNNWNGIQHVRAFLTDDWTTGSTMGTLDINGTSNLYVENCFFEGYTLGLADFSDNSRAVLRYSVWDNSAVTIHGPDTGEYGLRQLEVYNNVAIFNDTGDLTTAGLDYWITWRGGSGAVFDNVMPHLTSFAWGSKNDLPMECQMIRRNAGPYACWTGGYPVPHQTGQGYISGPAVEGVYLWDNSGSPTCSPKQYNPDECGNGLLIGTFIQENRDYFLIEKPDYTPYTYPHPLRNVTPGGDAVVVGTTTVTTTLTLP